MADKSAIQWTEATWNPVVGCSIASAGCINCYAMGKAARLERMGLIKYCNLTQDTKAGPVWNGNVVLDERSLDQPMRWRRPRIVFVNSMSDLFHEALTDAQIDQVFAVMALAPQHTFQVLTKRSARLRDYTNDPRTPARIARICIDMWIGGKTRPDGNWPVVSIGDVDFPDDVTLRTWPLPNVWLGVSVEDQRAADERITHLLKALAALRFLSCEPLLGPVDLTNIDPTGHQRAMKAHGWSAIWKDNGIGRAWVDWVIVGGESGPRARSCNAEWITSLIRQCHTAAVPVFVKQLGARFFCERDFIGGPAIRIDKDAGRDLTRRLKHPKGGDIAEWPERFRVREMPGVPS